MGSKRGGRRARTPTSTGQAEVHHNDEQVADRSLDGDGRRDGRSARKRRAITEAATALFLRDGYRNTSMDQVAADAAVSKQTVYKHFADQEQLFREIVLGATANAEAIITDLTPVLRSNEIDSAADLRTVLTDLARRYIDGVLRPNVLALRRLIIAEAQPFPDLAPTYFHHAPSRGIDVIAHALRTYEGRGRLHLGAARLAAAQ